jgi:hydroxyethylthiazole kinase-like uncharacterized protein yjeF
MIPVASSAEVRELDRRTIEELGVPSLALMELAAVEVLRVLLDGFEEQARRGVLVLAGPGNNGGDGWVIARHLHRRGYPVRVCTGPSRSEDCLTMRRAAEAFGVPVLREPSPAALIVDALLGTGLSSDVRGLIAERVAWMRQQGSPILAVDQPTGLCGETGAVLGDCAGAQVTVTFQHARIGQLLEPGVDLVGELRVVDIGLTPGATSFARTEASDVAAWLPAWPSGTHKGDRGHLGVVAGCRQMAGAAVLTCVAALRAGAGRVTLHIPEDALVRLEGLPPDVMVRTSDPGQARYDAMVVGPGLGQERQALAARIWRGSPTPAVFDADGLNALVGQLVPSPHPRAITPHPGEAARLLGWSAAQVQADRVGALRALARVAPTLLKGRNTLISGQPVLVNPTGGPALAVAGSGDVLAGVVGAFLARGLGPREALASAAWLHGLAGQDRPVGLLASELPQRIAELYSSSG